MYNIIPLILILISLSVIIVIVAKKFSVLANLDIENIQAEKEAKFKEQIIGNRLKRTVIKWGAKTMKIIKPAGNAIAFFFKWAYKKLHELKEETETKPIQTEEDAKRTIEKLSSEAEEMEKQENIAEAEKRYIEIIGLDSKNIGAFESLAKLYFKRKEYEEAKQTFNHVLKLKESINEAEIDVSMAQTFFDLALVFQAAGDFFEAAENMRKALELEPNNPRYLDTMLEISIIIKDKDLSRKTFEKLEAANPENQKLDDFKARIEEI